MDKESIMNIKDNRSIFYTTFCGLKYPIVILKDEDLYLTRGAKLISHTYSDNVGEIKFDRPIEQINYAMFSNYGGHNCDLACLWLPETVSVIKECIWTDEENITLYLRSKLPPRVLMDSDDYCEFFDKEELFEAVYVPVKSVQLYKCHPIWGHYHREKIIGYNL